MMQLREIKDYPVDQAYLFNHWDTAEKFGLPMPFRCGEPSWSVTSAFVTVAFFTPAGALHTAVVDHHNLSPLDPGETFPCDPLPLWESMGFEAWCAHRRRQPWWNDSPVTTRFQDFLDAKLLPRKIGL